MDRAGQDLYVANRHSDHRVIDRFFCVCIFWGGGGVLLVFSFFVFCGFFVVFVVVERHAVTRTVGTRPTQPPSRQPSNAPL